MKTPLADHAIGDPIVVDFEGRTDQAPILLGVRWPDGTVEQFVLAPDLEAAATAKDLRVCPIEDGVAVLVDRAELEGRPISGWSGHEIEVVDRYCSAALARRFRALYVDAKTAAKVARRRLRLELPAPRGRERRHALGRYLRLIGFDVPFPFGTGWTGETIRVLDSALGRHGAWAPLTPHQKRRWSFLLSHNRADLDGTAAVLRWSSAALDTAGLGTKPKYPASAPSAGGH